MKKLSLLTVCMLALSTISFSQTEKGSILLGGMVSFTNQLLDGDDILTINLNSNLGRFISDDLVAGMSFNYGHAKQGDFKTTSIAFLPFGRLYMGSSEGIKFFLQGEAGFVTAKSSFSSSSESATIKGASFGGGPGLSIFLNNNVAIEGVVKYQRVGGDFDTSVFGFLFGVQVYLSDIDN